MCIVVEGNYVGLAVTGDYTEAGAFKVTETPRGLPIFSPLGLKVRRPNNTSKYDSVAFLEHCIDIIREVVQTSTLSLATLQAIGISHCGQIDPVGCRLLFSPSHGITDVALCDRLTSEFNAPSFIYQEVAARLLTELKLGSGNNATYENIAYIFASYGVGGSLFLGGELYHGPNYMAGEIGHTIINQGGALCVCGQRGCVEASAGRWAISENIFLRWQRGEKTVLEPKLLDADRTKFWSNPISAEDLKSALHQNDALTLSVFTTAGEALGVMAANLINTLNLEAIFLGGDLFYDNSVLFNITATTAKEYALSSLSKNVTILQAEIQDEGFIHGALLNAMERICETQKKH